MSISSMMVEKMVYMASLPGMWGADGQLLESVQNLLRDRLASGYAIAPQPIMDRIRQYHDFNTVGAPSPLMEAAVVGPEIAGQLLPRDLATTTRT